MAPNREAEPPSGKAIFGSDETFAAPKPALNENAQPPFFGSRFHPGRSWAILCDSLATLRATPNNVCDYAHDQPACPQPPPAQAEVF